MKNIKIASLLLSLVVFGQAKAQPTFTPGTGIMWANPTSTHVGIGISSPLDKLHVVGNIRVEGNLLFTNGARKIGTSTDHSITLITKNIDRLVINKDGNVGIGETNPSQKLVVKSSDGVISIGPSGWRHSPRSTLLIRSSTQAPAEIDLQSVIDGTNSGWNFSSMGSGDSRELRIHSVDGSSFKHRFSLHHSNGFLSSFVDAGGSPAGNDWAPHAFKIWTGMSSTNNDVVMFGGPSKERQCSYISSVLVGKHHAPLALNYGGGVVTIGTVPDFSKTAGYALAVAGKIVAEEVTVKMYVNWPDYVFTKDYTMQPLSEVETFINENGHLPNIPSAAEVAEKGIDLARMNALLLEKIEELTLRVIEQDKAIRELQEKTK